MTPSTPPTPQTPSTPPTPGRRVDAVLFDLGRVLVEWDPYLPYAGRHTREEVDAFFTDVDFPTFNHRQDAGRTWAEARAEVAATHPRHVPLVDVYVEHFALAVPHEVPGAADLVDGLLSAGVAVHGLTNWSAETFPVAPTQAPVVARLQGVLVSGEVGIAKPDPRIFHLAAERFGLDPARTLFTDDAEVNVRAAERCGYLGHLFVGHEDLRARLRALGVSLPGAGAGAGEAGAPAGGPPAGAS